MYSGVPYIQTSPVSAQPLGGRIGENLDDHYRLTTTMPRIRDILHQGEPGQAVTIQGWVRTRREAKGVTFVDVNDGSSMAGLQVVLNADMAGYDTVVKGLTTGSSVEIGGTLVESPGKGQRVELQGETLTLFGTADGESYPLQKKRHSFEFLRTLGHLRSRTNTLGRYFGCAMPVPRPFTSSFASAAFMWMHTPIITASDCEGAGEMFAVTGLWI
jgi:asparaginyl-tRNA synthetase